MFLFLCIGGFLRDMWPRHVYAWAAANVVGFGQRSVKVTVQFLARA
jgi:hypothetical protein